MDCRIIALSPKFHFMFTYSSVADPQIHPKMISIPKECFTFAEAFSVSLIAEQ